MRVRYRNRVDADADADACLVEMPRILIGHVRRRIVASRPRLVEALSRSARARTGYPTHQPSKDEREDRDDTNAEPLSFRHRTPRINANAPAQPSRLPDERNQSESHARRVGRVSRELAPEEALLESESHDHERNRNHCTQRRDVRLQPEAETDEDQRIRGVER